MIFDSDVLIWCLRGNMKAAGLIEADAQRALSVVSYMELLQGARSKKEASLVRAFLKDLGFRFCPLTESIGHRAAVYMEEYALKHSLSMADALIAATAVEAQEVLCSGNAKHHRCVSELELKTFRP